LTKNHSVGISVQAASNCHSIPFAKSKRFTLDDVMVLALPYLVPFWLGAARFQVFHPKGVIVKPSDWPLCASLRAVNEAPGSL
jgi:hypothetical protein